LLPPEAAVILFFHYCGATRYGGPMAVRRGVCNWVLIAGLASAALSVGCSSKPEVVKANVHPGAMPSDGDWRGVYYDTVYGYLHITSTGDTAMGKWRTAAGDKWGEMSGKVDGDLFTYEWTEHRIGIVGPAANSTGKGYFKYVVPDGDNVDHEIHGEWGMDQNEAGYHWNAVKQRNMKPDPASVMPDETQTSVEGADWDGDKKSKNASGTEKKKKPEGEEDEWE
jgi:hypothetical protein